MKTLIVYYSYSGNNALLAENLHSRLASDIWKVVERKKRNGFRLLFDIIFRRTPAIEEGPDLSARHYDNFIFVAPVWAGRIANPLKTFLKTNADLIGRYSFITLCGGGGNTGLAAELTKLAGKSAVIVAELKVVDLLPADKKNKIMYTSGYRVTKEDMLVFDKPVRNFLDIALGHSAQVSGPERLQGKGSR